MTKNSKSRRNRWADLWPKPRLPRGRHAADDTVVPIIPEPVADVDYIGRHRSTENPCAPFTSDTYSAPDTGPSDSGGSRD